MATSEAAGSTLRLVNAPSSLWRGTGDDLRAVWSQRELLRAFVARELRSRYKGTALGWGWALARPLVMLLVYGLAIGVFLGAGRSTPQFMVFIYTGLLAWTLFTTVVMGCINAVTANGPLLTRANFSRLLLPLSVLIAASVDFLLQASILVVAYLIEFSFPTLGSAVWIVPSLFVLLLVALGVGLILSAVNVYIRDIGFLTEVALQVGFWLTPVIYSYGQVVRGSARFGASASLVSHLYMLNPMANVVIGFQRALWPAARTAAAAAYVFPGRLSLRLGILAAVALALAWIGMRIFVRLSADFGQEL